MPDSIDQLFSRWQANPDVAQTVKLCEALRAAQRADLVEIVGSHAARQLDVPALVAAARMYAGNGRLDDAQTVLLAAGRLAPRDGEVFKWLGEVLLRRGDAERAEKVLERAMQFGAADPATKQMLDSARGLLPTQRSSGMMAVAQEIARSLTNGGNGGNGGPHKSDDSQADLETLIQKSVGRDALTAAANAALGKPLPAAGAAPPMPAPLPRAPEPPPPLALGFQQTEDVNLPPHSSSGAAPASGAMTGGGMAEVASGPMPMPPAPAPPAPPMPFSQREPPMNPLLAAARAKPLDASGQRVPEPRDVLEALQIAGVYEPDGAVRPQQFAWDKPDKGKRSIRSVIALVAIAGLLVGGGLGTLFWVRDKREKQHVEADALLAQIDADLRAGVAARLEPDETSIGQAFELESRSPHAALTWLHERAMVGLLKGGENVAFEDGTQRAKEVGVEEKKLAFAYAASFLFQNDTAGAASAIAKWDGKADDDAWYQLLAGATFERAGDGRAIERYEAAVRLDPELIVAQVLLARATAVDGDPQKALDLGKEFRKKYPDRPEGAGLVTLAWSRSPFRGEAPKDAPPEFGQVSDMADGVLPSPLRAVPHAARAVAALDQHKYDDAKASLQKGLAVADTPGVAAWLGSVALETGDEALARKAALAAVSFSAVYPPARMLAARVALLGGRLDEALKATEDLSTASPDVVVVTAAAAYERLDAERMKLALDGLADDTKKLPFLVPLGRGQAVLGGAPNAVPADKALEIADGESPWGDLVAIDAALDAGDLDLAHKVVAKWAGEPKALRALRLARLARYEGKTEDAERWSRAALEGATVTVRALAERVFCLVAANKTADAIALFKSYPNVGGPLAKWLRAYAVASGGKVEEAKAIVSQEDPPSALSPVPARIYAAAAYGAMKDTRHGSDYVRALAQAGIANPDVATAAEKLGGGHVGRHR